MQIYLVGGAVRDKLLELPVKEKDWVVVGAKPDDLINKNFKKVGKDFPVFLHPETQEEYALARVERKTGKGYYGFVCDSSETVTLEEDLKRRDLTINAIAQNEKGEIIDPYNGKKDLENKILRHVSSSFTEDPVRILRIARFLARLYGHGFAIADETKLLMNDMVKSGELDHLVPERVWKELSRALMEPYPTQFFLCLRECGALEKIFPSLNKLWGIPQNIKYHPEVDTGLHVMLSLEKAVELGAELDVRFAVLCHDLGKGTTPADILPSHIGHEERGVNLVKQWCKQYRVPKNITELSIKVSRWHLHCHKIKELKAKTILKLFSGLDAFRNSDNIDKFALACKADSLGRYNVENKNYDQVKYLKKAFEVVNEVDVAEFVQQGLVGAKIGEAIYKSRIKKLNDFLKIERKYL